MLNPKHQCAWTRRKHSEIQLYNGSVVSAGVSLPVLLTALHQPELVWFSSPEPDPVEPSIDAICLAVLRENVELGEIKCEKTVGLVSRALSDTTQVAEYHWNERTSQCLKLPWPGHEWLLERKTTAESLRCAILSHDECFCQSFSTDDKATTRILHHVLNMHAFYCGREIDWSLLVPQLLARLNSTGGLRLRTLVPWFGSRRWLRVAVPSNPHEPNKRPRFRREATIPLYGQGPPLLSTAK